MIINQTMPDIYIAYSKLASHIWQCAVSPCRGEITKNLKDKKRVSAEKRKHSLIVTWPDEKHFLLQAKNFGLLGILSDWCWISLFTFYLFYQILNSKTWPRTNKCIPLKHGEEADPFFHRKAPHINTIPLIHPFLRLHSWLSTFTEQPCISP